MIGIDSTTPNAGVLRMVACSVDCANAVDVIMNIPREVKDPKSALILPARVVDEYFPMLRAACC